MDTQEMLSLDKLYDIVIPDGPSWWPPSPGLWVLLIAVVLVLVLIGCRLYLRWHRNRYRRAGLYLLHDADTEYDVSVILKRVALAAYPRGQVASLYGAEWAAFLQKTCPQSKFPEGFSGDQSQQVSPALMESAAGWIKHHRSAAENRAGA